MQSQKVANQRFIQSIAPYAQESERATGVPASVAMGQAILESGWGRSGLTVWGGAYFGIKCSNVTSPLQKGCSPQQTLEYDASASPRSEVARFRTYATPRDSFVDHGRFLRDNPRYAPAFTTKDPAQFAASIQQAGYATHPDYAAQVMSVIDANGLRRYDQAALATATPTPTGSTPVDGTIGVKWRALGAESSPLGVSVGGEFAGPAGTTAVVFEHGLMLWTDQHGAYALTGPAWELYRSDGALRERLAAPIGDPDATGSIPFENGRIVVEGGKAKAA